MRLNMRLDTEVPLQREFEEALPEPVDSIWLTIRKGEPTLPAINSLLLQSASLTSQAFSSNESQAWL